MFRRLLNTNANTTISIGHLLRSTFVPVESSPCLLYLSFSTETTCVSSKDYLESSLSLSAESKAALKIYKCKPIPIRSTANADSVMALFKHYGFNNTHLAKIFYISPKLLNVNPHETLKPKLYFLAQNCIYTDTLVHILTSNPYILQRSLRTQIVPSIDFLEKFFNNNHQAINSFLLHKRAGNIIKEFSENTVVNVETLRHHGVPDSSILKLVLLGGGPFSLAHDTEQFANNLREILDMGFDLSGTLLPKAIKVFSSMSKEKWVSKMEVIKKCFGWSDDQQVVALFVKQPAFMSLSEEKLRQGLEVFMKTLRWTPDYIAKYPALLTCSLEKRILPRIRVLEILQFKGALKEGLSGNAFLVSEDEFLRLYVNKYQQDLPQVQLMEIYSKNMQNLELHLSKSN